MQIQLGPAWRSPEGRLTVVIHWIRKKPCLWTAKGISMPVESNERYEVKGNDHSYMLALSAIKGTGDSPTT